MGFSKHFSIVSGFIVNESDLFDYENHEEQSCLHASEYPNASYCPECGKKVFVRKYQTRDLKDIFKNNLSQDIDDEHNGMWRAQMSNGDEVVLRHLVDNYSGCGAWFVGKEHYTISGSKCVEDGIHCKIIPSDLVDELELSVVLHDNSMPYVPDSFGLYFLEDLF